MFPSQSTFVWFNFVCLVKKGCDEDEKQTLAEEAPAQIDQSDWITDSDE